MSIWYLAQQYDVYEYVAYINEIAMINQWNAE